MKVTSMTFCRPTAVRGNAPAVRSVRSQGGTSLAAEAVPVLVDNVMPQGTSSLRMNFFRDPNLKGRRSHQLEEQIVRLFLMGLGVPFEQLDQHLHTMIGAYDGPRPARPSLPALDPRFRATPIPCADPPYPFEGSTDHELIKYAVWRGGYFPIALSYRQRGKSCVSPIITPQLSIFYNGELREASKYLMDRFGYSEGVFFPNTSLARSDALPHFAGMGCQYSNATKEALRCSISEIASMRSGPRKPRVLIIGNQVGCEAVSIVKRFDTLVDCVDDNPMAVANTLASGIYTGTNHAIRAWVSDDLTSVTDRYDVIVAKVEGGVGGFLSRMYARLPHILAPERKFFLIGPRSLPHVPEPFEAEAVPSKFGEDGPSIHEIVRAG